MNKEEVILTKVKARLFETYCREVTSCKVCNCLVKEKELQYENCKEKYEDLYLIRDFEEKIRTVW